MINKELVEERLEEMRIEKEIRDREVQMSFKQKLEAQKKPKFKINLYNLIEVWKKVRPIVKKNNPNSITTTMAMNLLSIDSVEFYNTMKALSIRPYKIGKNVSGKRYKLWIKEDLELIKMILTRMKTQLALHAQSLSTLDD